MWLEYVATGLSAESIREVLGTRVLPYSTISRRIEGLYTPCDNMIFIERESKQNGNSATSLSFTGS